MQVLITDDDAEVVETLMDYLVWKGVDVDCAYSGDQAVSRLRQQHFDVIVLDIMMAGQDGLATCKLLRQNGCATPILFLTARDTLEDKINGFEAGCDDYLVKPFAMEELYCRIRALGQRISRHALRTLRVGELTMDTESGKLLRAGHEIKLKPAQFKLVQVLMEKSPGIVSRQQLEALLWDDEEKHPAALRTHLYQIRQQLDKPFASPMLETVHRRGYRLVVA